MRTEGDALCRQVAGTASISSGSGLDITRKNNTLPVQSIAKTCPVGVYQPVVIPRLLRVGLFPGDRAAKVNDDCTLLRPLPGCEEYVHFVEVPMLYTVLREALDGPHEGRAHLRVEHVPRDIA